MFNAQSIRSKFDELLCYVAEEEPDFICITEAWVSEGYFGDNLLDYQIQGYNTFSCDRGSEKKGGGILIYVNELLSATLLPDNHKNLSVESLWLDVTVGKGKSGRVRVGAFYRPGTLTLGDQLELDKCICEEIQRNYCSQCLIIGDFNLRDYEDAGSGSPACKMFRKCLEENLFMHQFVNEPTRKNSILDLVFSDVGDLVQALSVGETLGNSDHSIVRFMLQISGTVKDNLTVIPNFGKADFDSFRLALQEIRWEHEFADLNAYEMWDKFKSILHNVQLGNIPQKHRRKRKLTKPAWLTTDVRKEIRIKKNAFKKFKTNPNDSNLVAYRTARDAVKKLIRGTKRSKEMDLAKNCNRDSKKFFSFYKLSKVSNSVGPLEVNGNLVTEDVEIVEELSSQFKSVFTSEDKSKLPIVDHSLVPPVRLGSIDPISAAVVSTYLKKIKPNKAAGPDEVYARILHEAREQLAQPLSIIFDRSFLHCEIPADWKRANVVPIFKKGSKGKVENYRPVSLTSLVCKVLESIIKDHMVCFLDEYSLIRETQHGFRKGRSCLTNLLEFLDFVSEQFDIGNQVDAAYLDFSKAFDKVPHARLILQLELHGFSGPLIKWIESWLTRRQQRVILNGARSSWQEVLSGVPQGSVLGPLLFIVFVNSIEEGLNSRVLKFADDIKIFRSVQGEIDHNQLQEDLNNLVHWSEEWQMKFNFDKCKVMHVGRDKYRDAYLMGGQVLAVTEQERDLGVVLNNKLGVSEQCKVARGKALRMLGAINRNVAYKNGEVIKKLYCAYVRPHLEFCIQAWSPTYEKDSWLLERVQKRATKMVNGLSNLSYGQRLKKLDMFSLRYRRLRGDLIETFKFVHGQDTGYMKDMFEFSNSNIVRGHKYKIKTKHSRTRLRQSFFSNRVTANWNRLPESIVSSSSLNVFKNRIDEYFREKGLVFRYKKDE